MFQEKKKIKPAPKIAIEDGKRASSEISINI